MTIDEAIASHVFLDQMIEIKDCIEKIENKNEKLRFTTPTKDHLGVEIDHKINIKLQKILDKHHKMIIQELKDQVVQLNKAIEQL